MINFEWNNLKNAYNQRKHGISFEQARYVFADEFAILFDDPDHSQDEERFLILGMSPSGICIVSHCYREHKNTIRIISARKATKKEQKAYNNHRKGN